MPTRYWLVVPAELACHSPSFLFWLKNGSFGFSCLDILWDSDVCEPGSRTLKFKSLADWREDLEVLSVWGNERRDAKPYSMRLQSHLNGKACPIAGLGNGTFRLSPVRVDEGVEDPRSLSVSLGHRFRWNLVCWLGACQNQSNSPPKGTFGFQLLKIHPETEISGHLSDFEIHPKVTLFLHAAHLRHFRVGLSCHVNGLFFLHVGADLDLPKHSGEK